MCRSMVDIQSVTAGSSEEKKKELEMWANAQRDGRPAEYGWRTSMPQSLVECRAVTLPVKPVEICRGAPNSPTDLSR